LPPNNLDTELPPSKKEEVVDRWDDDARHPDVKAAYAAA
jgi:hypothetical protein